MSSIKVKLYDQSKMSLLMFKLSIILLAYINVDVKLAFSGAVMLGSLVLCLLLAAVGYCSCTFVYQSLMNREAV